MDTRNNELLETVDLKTLGFSESAKAHHTAVEPDGSFWYVSLISAGKILKFDRQNRLVAQSSFEAPGMLSLDPTSDRLYVGRSMAAVNPPQRIGVIQRSSMEIEEVDVFFPRPHALAVDPHGERFFTASLGQNSVAYGSLGVEEVDLFHIDGTTHTLVQFALSPNGDWMVAGGQVSGELLIFDLSTWQPTLVKSVPVGGQPWHPSFSSDGTTVWIPNQSANSVTVVDVETWTVIDVIRHPALAEPHGSAISPDGSTVYISGRNVAGTYQSVSGDQSRPGTVVAIDIDTRSVIAVIEVGRYAAGMSVASAISRD
ncbi:MAG TPA: YncE family protein [Gemmatimonadetes bacterium]|nr:YncE family protein [Gemmatimonadota bacterium]